MMDALSIKPRKEINAVIKAPPSKSYTQRALIVSSLADGDSTIKNPLFSDDSSYMINALGQLGVKIQVNQDGILVHGSNGYLSSPKETLYVGNAGTAMRFLAALCALCGGKITIDGDDRMRERPLTDLLLALNQLGVRSESNKGCPPVIIHGGGMGGGNITLKGDVSSQYLSSILMTAPYAKQSTQIGIMGDLASKPYADITLDVMNNFGVRVSNKNYKTFTIKNSQKYRATDYKIEGDASSASYFLAAAAITKGTVRVENLNPNSMQGDIRFADILQQMGCHVKKGDGFIEVTGDELEGIEVDMNKMPDVVPTLAVVSLFAGSSTKIKNVPNLRVKETDRIKALSTEISRLGAHVMEFEDGLEINASKCMHGAEIETYNDHRMAMSFAIAGLEIDGIKIKNPNCVSKSFPNFWDVFNTL